MYKRDHAPPFLADALLVGILVVIVGEFYLFDKLGEFRDSLIDSGSQVGHPPPEYKGGGGGGQEVLVVGSLTAGVDKLHYYPRL